jgi:hypothetical protein
VSVVLAFVFGYSLTLGPVLQSGVAFGAALGVAFAADTVSIAVMEVIDNLIMLVPARWRPASARFCSGDRSRWHWPSRS